jgi:hypothetical protein
MATGALGWSPESTRKATVAEIRLAIEMKMEIQRLSSPGHKKPQPEKPQPMSAFLAKVIQMPGTKVHGRE